MRLKKQKDMAEEKGRKTSASDAGEWTSEQICAPRMMAGFGAAREYIILEGHGSYRWHIGPINRSKDGNFQ